MPTGPSVAEKLAKALGFHYYDQAKTNPALWANAIISRYPIGKPTDNDLGAEIDVNGRKVYAFNIHLTDFPYQPYQLLGIDYGPAPFLKTADEAVAAATKARGPALDLAMKDMKQAEGADAVFLFGDFNEPSYRDWTDAAVKAGNQPMAVKYPSALRIEQDAGMTDLLRAAYPDEVAKPAFTWTPTSEPTAKDDHHDRIDYVFGRSPKLETLSVSIVGEKKPEADIVVTPWPSDHRAVVAKVRFLGGEEHDVAGIEAVRHQQAEDGKRTEILGIAADRRDFRRDAVDQFLDRRIDRLDAEQHQHQDDEGDEFAKRGTDIGKQPQADDQRQQFVAKRRLADEPAKALEGIATGCEEMGNARLLLDRRRGLGRGFLVARVVSHRTSWIPRRSGRSPCRNGRRRQP